MRTPRSAAPVFAASRVDVFAPSAMAAKISNSIPAFSAAVCWKALRALKMRSGLGRLAAVGVAMDGSSFRGHRLYTRIPSKRIFRGQTNCREPVPLAYSLLPATTKRRPMQREYHRWYSHRLGMELGVVVHGHWGAPLLGFPTSAGDEWELEGQSMIGALADFIDAGRIKFFSINSINGQSFYHKGAD